MTLKINPRFPPYSAMWKGELLEMSIRQWAFRADKSVTFISKHLALAKADGLPREDRMQYALAQESNYGKCGSKPRKTPQRTEQQRREIVNDKARDRQKMLFKMGAAR